MVKHELLRRKLAALGETLQILKKCSRYSLEEFISEPERYGSAERFLQVAIEILDDIGSHIVSDDGLGSIDNYADIPRLLFANGRIGEKSRESWIQMIGFRNLLVHGYAKIDRSIVYRVVCEGLADIERLEGELAQLL
jgi:uncharacterized protein YutE (UPF0331/DUF86 family)